MKEMLGGCCVCSDERGWTENPLVYCDGQGCTVAVHQACYGIVTVPTGPWFCRKCESQERSARVRCELCPSRDGALKRTDQAGWAHVVCALYIPEVRFGNVTTMEPIILQLIPGERFNKTCYICEEKSRGSRATVGACMQCNKTGCKQQFHVTCAQALGLLCEEAGNYLDNVKYCGYCQHHYSKLKKGGNVKTIPPYKPIQADNGSSDSSPEKEAETPLKTTATTTKRKGSSSKSTTNTKNKTNPSPSIEINGTIDDKIAINERTAKDNNSNSGNKFTSSNFIESVVTHSESVFGNEVPTGSLTNQQVSSLQSAKGIITNQQQQQQKSINQQKSSSSSSKSSGHTSKKRKTGARTPTVPANDNSNNSISSEASGTIIVGSSSSLTTTTTAATTALQTPMSTVQSTITEATSLSANVEPEKTKKSKIDSPPVASNLASDVTSTPPVIMCVTLPSQMPINSPTTAQTSANSIVVSVPLTATSLTNSMQSIVTSAPTLYQQLQQSMVTTPANNDTRFTATNNPDNFNHDDAPAKRSRSQSTEKQDKTRKAKRGSSNSQPSLAIPPGPGSNSPAATTTTSTTTLSSGNSGVVVVTTTKRAGRNSNNNNNNNNNQHSTPPPPPVAQILPPPAPLPSSTATTSTVAPVASIIQGPTLGTGHFSSVGIGSGNTMGPVVKDSPPSSPGSESMSSTGPGRRKRKSAGGIGTAQNSTGATQSPTPTASTAQNVLLNNTKDEKDVKLFQNGISAPHMLGNQLNPSSTMAQKMSDTLNQELEAHSIFTDTSNSSNLVGPQLHSRVIASIRSSQPQAPPATSFSSVFSTNSNNANSNALGGGAIPQTLDQLLERQWEQGSQFLMEQAQHFDIASLLSCLHQLRAENLRLEEHVNSLLQRRDHLLAVNARLAIPLTTQPSSSHPNNIHPGMSSNLHPTHQNIAHSDGPPGGSSTSSSSMSRMNRDSRVNNTYMPHSSSTPMENGLPPDPSPPAAAGGASIAQYPHRGSLVPPQPSPTTIRHSPAASNYHQGQSSNIVSPANANNSNIVRNSTPDPLRGIPRSLPQSSSSYMYQQPTMSSSFTSNQIGSVHSLHNPHGPTTTSHHGPSGKPS